MQILYINQFQWIRSPVSDTKTTRQVTYIQGKSKLKQFVHIVCLNDNIINDDAQHLNKLVHIQKIFNQPESLLEKLNIYQEFDDYFRDFFQSDSNQVDNQIADLEKKMKIISDEIQQLFQEQLTNLKKIKEYRSGFINNVLNVMNIESVKLTLKELKNVNSINSFEEGQKIVNKQIQAICKKFTNEYKLSLEEKIIELQKKPIMQLMLQRRNQKCFEPNLKTYYLIINLLLIYNHQNINFRIRIQKLLTLLYSRKLLSQVNQLYSYLNQK